MKVEEMCGTLYLRYICLVEGRGLGRGLGVGYIQTFKGVRVG